MFKFCKMSLNCDLSENPIMCLQCWQNLQICYSFRKCYLETDKKIRAYFTFYHIKAKNVTVQVVEEMGKYFLEHDDIFNLQKVVKEEIFCDNIDSNRYSLRKRVKKEYLDNIVKCDEFEDKPIKKENSGALFQKRPKRHLFTKEEVEFLLNTYLNITNNDTCAALNPWKKIQVEWDKNFSSKLTCDTISRKLKRVLANKTKVQLTKTTPQRNSMANKQKRIKNSSILPSRRQSSDSDDSFVDEVIPSSFAPIIKPEPLSDTEEYHIINQKMDLPPSDSETDNESLPIPELERMDVPQMNYQIERIPHMNFGIQDISSVDVKRESINMFSTSGELNPNVVIENLTTTKRITFKNQNNETIYKCMQCNFETKYKYSADRHYNRHANSMSKGFECIHCSFVTSKYFLLKHHLSTNHEDNSINYGCNDELPVLMPYTI